MATPMFTMACQAYDRMQPLRDGTVRLVGAELNFLDLPVEETFFRMVKYREFDIAELSLSTYVLTLAQGAPFVAVPVFPSRAFRHSGVTLTGYISAARGQPPHESAALAGHRASAMQECRSPGAAPLHSRG